MTDRKMRRHTSARSIGVALIIIIYYYYYFGLLARTAHAGNDTRAHTHTHTRTAGRINRVLFCARETIFILYIGTFNLVSHDIIICVFYRRVSRPYGEPVRFSGGRRLGWGREGSADRA